MGVLMNIKKKIFRAAFRVETDPSFMQLTDEDFIDAPAPENNFDPPAETYYQWCAYEAERIGPSVQVGFGKQWWGPDLCWLERDRRFVKDVENL